MKRFGMMILVGVVLGSAGGAGAVDYDKPVTLVGVLKASTGETSDGKKVQFPSLRLNKPIDVESSDPDEIEKNVSLIQLAMKPEMMRRYKVLKGKSAKVDCVLFHSDNGNHYTKVLCEVNSISGGK